MNYAIDLVTKVHRVLAKGEPPLPSETVVSADADGWIPWCGKKKCPLPDDQDYEAKCGDGKIASLWNPECNGAWDREWGNMPNRYFITAYRPILGQVNKMWDGEGQPGPGEVCRILEFTSSGQWSELHYDYRIDFIGRSVVVATTMDAPNDVERVFTKPVKLKPVLTERQQWVKAAEKVSANLPLNSDEGAFLEALFDAGLAKLPENKDA